LNDQPKTTLGTQFGHGELFNRGKLLIIGGADGSRTHDLLNAIQNKGATQYRQDKKPASNQDTCRKVPLQYLGVTCR
jgi:hypothetical protein